MMNRTSIPNCIAQEVLDSAHNAAEKGLSQFFTPEPLAQQLSAALPRLRPVIVDLNCGDGTLLRATRNDSTRHLLGADIDPTPKAGGIDRIVMDLTRLYPMLSAVNWKADLFVLNPPWRLLWHKDRLADLSESECDAVRDAFAASEPGVTGLDSTVATLMIALDRCSWFGEGLLIGNNATLRRLILDPAAPFNPLAAHIWLHLIMDGNPMTGRTDCQWQEGEPFQTGVIFFAAGHRSGPHQQQFAAQLDLSRLRSLRMGPKLESAHSADVTTVDFWHNIKAKLKEQDAPRWNLWIEDGQIRTYLSRFDQLDRRADRKRIARLYALNNQTPMQLVVQRAQRDELRRAVLDDNWRVHPDLPTAIERAIDDYNAARAPIYPLSPVKRLGYCDEHDWLLCTRDLGPFQAGQRYPIRTQTVLISRIKERPSVTGEMETVRFSGHELAILLTPVPWQQDVEPDYTVTREYLFMDARIKDEANTEFNDVRHGTTADCPKVDYDLLDLVGHFEIPEVPDAAALNPEGYRSMLEELERIETAIATLTHGGGHATQPRP